MFFFWLFLPLITLSHNKNNVSPLKIIKHDRAEMRAVCLRVHIMVECSDKRRHDGRVFRMKAAEAAQRHPRNTDSSQSEGFDF